MQKPKKLAKAVGLVLRSLRIGRRFNQRQLAGLAGIKQASVCLIERGYHDFRLSSLERICKALDVSVWAVIKMAEEKDLA